MLLTNDAQSFEAKSGEWCGCSQWSSGYSSGAQPTADTNPSCHLWLDTTGALLNAPPGQYPVKNLFVLLPAMIKVNLVFISIPRTSLSLSEVSDKL